MGSDGCEGGHGEAEAEEHASRRVLERMPSRDGIHLSESPLTSLRFGNRFELGTIKAPHLRAGVAQLKRARAF